MNLSDCPPSAVATSARARLDLAEDFIATFCTGDLERLGRLLTEDFRFDGPLLSASSRAEYLAALVADPPSPGSSYRLLHSFEEEGAVCLAYRYSKPGSSILVAQWCRFRCERISEVTLVFDTEAVG